MDRSRGIEELFAQYVDRLNAGQPIDRAQVREEYPNLADELLPLLEDFIDSAELEPVSTSLGTLGDYTLRRQIGRGGMGVVYEAWENSMDRQVALKVLPAGIAADDRAFQRFMQEARTAGKLSHPNVAPVFGVGIKDHTPYFAMEYVEGETLAQILSKTKDAEPETETPFGKKDDVHYFHNLADAFADVADGLQHAHSKGVTHRDIKPSNLILDSEGRLRILDFGLARLEGQESLTISGDVMGTPLYMSPEQARRKKIPVDHRTDVYSLGATMYESIIGRPPFRGKDHADTLSQIIERDPLEPKKVNPRVPKDLETIMLKCLRKDAGDRYGTAEALGQDLRRFVRGDPIEARPTNRWERFARRLARHRVILATVAAILLLGGAGLAISTAMIARERDLAEVGWRESRWNLYVASVQLAHEDWKRGNLARFGRLLDSQIPSQDQDDLRGWEWYYFNDLRVEALGKHSGKVFGVAWSPDGSLVASAGADGLKLWNAGDRELLDTLAGAHYRVAWSPHGDRLASLGNVARGAELRVWRRVGNTLDAKSLLTRTVGSAAPAAISRDPRIRHFDSLAWSPNGELLAYADMPRIEILQAADLSPVKAIELPDEPLSEPFRRHPGLVVPETYRIDSVAWSPDASWLFAATLEPGRVFLWNTATWEHRVIDAHLWKAHGAVAHPNGRVLATGGYGELFERGEIRLWHLVSGEPDSDRHLIPQRAGVLDIAWSPDGAVLAAARADGAVAIHDLVAEIDTELHGHVGRALCLSWAPDVQRRRLVSGGFDGRVVVWDLTRFCGPAAIAAKRSVSWSRDGRLLAAGMLSDKGLLVTDPDSGVAISEIEIPHFNLRCLAFHPTGSLLAAGGDIEGEGVCVLADASTGEIAWRFAAGGTRVRTLGWSPDGSRLAIGGNEPGVRVWEVSERREIVHFTGERPMSIDALAWSPNGRWIAAGGRDQKIRLWEVGSEREEWLRELHARSAGGWRSAVAWSPDSSRIAAGSSEGLLVVLEARSGRVLLERHAHALEVVTLAWHPDGRRVASGSSDQTVKLWDAETLNELLRLQIDDLPNRVAWSPDGSQLAAAGYRTETRVWRAPLDDEN